MLEKLRDIKLEHSTIKEIEMITDERYGGVDMPKTCRVLEESRPGKESLTYSEILQPENWNGIYIGMGNGGYGGRIAGSFVYYVQRGYAVAQTDKGTSMVRKGIMLEGNPDMWIDYGWRATHIMTQTAKKLIETYYGHKPEYSYFVGSSAGGKQALKEAQSFSEEYDGILAGVPSNNTLCLVVYFLWLHIQFRDCNGKAQFTREETEKISKLAASFFQQRGDGEPGDDFVTWPYSDEHTVSDFLEYLKNNAYFLKEHQLEILKTVYSGLKNSKTGEMIYCGLPIGAEINLSFVYEDAENDIFAWPWFKLFFGKDYQERTFKFADDFEQMFQKLGQSFAANAPNLTAFKEHGGKMIMYSGSADPFGPWPDAVKYDNRVCDTMGGLDTVMDCFRYFIFPGMAHGSSGLGTNEKWADTERHTLLDALRDWREKDIAPDHLIAAHVHKEDEAEKVKFIRKVYPYKGDKEEGKDFPPCCADRYL